jgi:hypothetical protein
MSGSPPSVRRNPNSFRNNSPDMAPVRDRSCLREPINSLVIQIVSKLTRPLGAGLTRPACS